MKIKNSKKGMSLVECVVAIAIIVIFSICAMTCAMNASSIIARSTLTYEASSFCTDLQKCFAIASSPEEFEKMVILLGVSYEKTDNVYIFDYPMYTVTADADPEHLLVRAVHKENDRLLYEIDYKVR